MAKRTWQDNAAEFAALDRGEGWQFAILVACSVEKGKDHGGVRAAGQRLNRDVGQKTSGRNFAANAGTGTERVLRYLAAWQEAAGKGWVPDASELTPDNARTFPIPVQPWKATDGGVYDASAATTMGNSVERVAARAAKDADYAQQVISQVTKANTAGAREAFRADPKVAREARLAIEQKYADSPKAVTPPGPLPVHDAEDLVAEFRSLHRTVDRIVRHINEGRAVVSETTRDAILREVKWLRTALGYIEDGVASDSLSSEIAEFLASQS